ncbi:MAG TPA: peptide-methionine (S)-S-oxide reductase MsrA [Candidatus Krumholzibacteria bacterium]|nr:peptide-methionine (S)-S-oxide reductase MsrA [Candidatus Krumholzibacteria bacterium]HPD72906.1 peptide-methionine (S)-S-oxide reductase MsrA [Candidatus Krumholzibacteria bacterium]HRY41705.1 peptide-methionine (S)-S-oxide reductase MsrA [Candidatus Krumholzibacteria bacterium]
MASDETTSRSVATLGGGCFWCLEAVFEEVAGVLDVVSGYAGGHVENPDYHAVCGGATGHAEVVQVAYDPARISYEEILLIYFGVHDPTTRDRQGADVGPQYRSVILWRDPAEKAAAERLIADLERDRIFDGPIVTEVVPLGDFWPAEKYHQDYYRNNPDQGYCQVVIAPKLAKFRQEFKDRLRAR